MSISLPTNTLTDWIILGSVNSDGTSINITSNGVSNPAANTIGTFLGVFESSFTSVTNGAAIKYATLITIPSAGTLHIVWQISGGDIGNSFYNDKAYLTISGPSTNITILIASTTTSTSGTYTRSISPGTFTIGFASFNSGDTAVDFTLSVSEITFTYTPLSPPPTGGDVIDLISPGRLFGDSYTNVRLPLVLSMTDGDCFNVYLDTSGESPAPPQPPSGYTILSGIKSPVGSSGMTQLQNISADDSFIFNVAGITTPRTINFPFSFYGLSYTQPYFASNTYITFGSGSTAWNGLSLNPPNPALPALHLGSADNSWQRCWELSDSNRYRFRYEGTSSTSGVVGNPNIVYEITFFKQTSPSENIYIEIVVGVHGRTTGRWGMTNGTSLFTDFATLVPATGLVGASGALQANNSYILVFTPTGQFQNLYSSSYIEWPTI